MKRFRYNKRGLFIIIEEKQTHEQTTSLCKYYAMFSDVPFTQSAWKTKPLAEIINLFKAAANEAMGVLDNSRAKNIKKHNQTWWPWRKWSNFWGWTAPPKVSINELYLEIITKCEELSLWMKDNQKRPFYINSDMSPFIVKPKAVATALRDIVNS